MGANRDRHEGIDSSRQTEGDRCCAGVIAETVVPGTRAIRTHWMILDAALLRLSHWVGQYYLATLGEVFGTILPPSLRSETQRTIASSPELYVSDALENGFLTGFVKARASSASKG